MRGNNNGRWTTDSESVVHLFRLQCFIYILKLIYIFFNKKMSNKKVIISLVSILILLMLGWLYYSSNIKKTDKFNGTVKEVGVNSVLIYGAFADEIAEFKPLYDFDVEVSKNTTITKESFIRPAEGIMFEPSKLEKYLESSSFEVLKKDSKNVAIGIEVTLERDFLGRVTKKAYKINFIAPKY